MEEKKIILVTTIESFNEILAEGNKPYDSGFDDVFIWEPIYLKSIPSKFRDMTPLQDEWGEKVMGTSHEDLLEWEGKHYLLDVSKYEDAK